jgi:hypothetical protein
MLITDPSARGNVRQYAEPAPEECAKQIEPDRAPELLDRCFDHRVVSRGRSTRVVVQNV